MSKIFCIVGKSASGKDTMYKSILSEKSSDLIPVIPYTTRPMRNGEADGVDYRFVTKDELSALEKNDKIIEKRSYNTVNGVWDYFTAKFDIENNKNYILITTLDGVKGIINHYGNDMVQVIYLVLDDKERLIRCIERESQQKSPNYAEVCRRFLADREDFAVENLSGIKNIHYIDTSVNTSECVKQWHEIYSRNQ